jgi:hypothetical protein
MCHAIGWCCLAAALAASAPARAHGAAPPAEPSGAPAQPAEAEPEVLIPKSARHGWWGAPVVQVSTVRDRAAVFVGGRGGWLLGGRLTLGGGGFGLATRIPAPRGAGRSGENLDLGMGYGGGWLEYTFSPSRLVHVSVGTLVGGGALSLEWHDGGSYDGGGDGFFVAEPAVLAELNVAGSVRLDVGAAYRRVFGASVAGLSNSDVSGVSAVLAVKFGRF